MIAAARALCILRRAMQLVDIGANLTHAAFQPDLHEVIERARAAGVAAMIVTGTTVEDARRALALADAHPGALYATAGIHPHHARDFGPAAIPALRELARHPRLVAIGECGLDFNRNYSPHPDQEKCFAAQAALAREIGKPLFLHCREAFPLFIRVLKAAKPPKGVAHCFTGTREELEACLDLDLYIGITGWICDERRGRELVQISRDIPAERLLVETDAPYLVPRDLRPQPKARRNEPACLPHVLRALARARGEAPEDLARVTTENAKRLFGIA